MNNLLYQTQEIKKNNFQKNRALHSTLSKKYILRHGIKVPLYPPTLDLSISTIGLAIILRKNYISRVNLVKF